LKTGRTLDLPHASSWRKSPLHAEILILN